MGSQGQFTWATLGKADYAQASALVASLPEPIRAKLVNGTREILCRITFLCWRFSQTSGRGKAYAIPSERYLGQAIGRSPRTVRRCLAILKAGRLLTWTRRMSKDHVPLTNMYELGASYLASLYARFGKKLQQLRVRTKMADNDLKKGIEAEPLDEARASLSSILANSRLQRSALASSQPNGEAQEVENEAERVAERKAFLRGQWQQLQKDGVL